MKYTTKTIQQAQLVGGVKINPKGGELKDDEVKRIIADPWGKELINKGALVIEGVKPEDLVEKPKPKKPRTPKPPATAKE